MPGPGRRADALVFSLVLLGVGYFHQGGGWNQNSRFALVRSIVDDASFFIDSQLVYAKDPADPSRLLRIPAVRGNIERGAASQALAWRGSSGGLTAVDPAAAQGRKLVLVDDVAASGDVAYFGGHFHPNKAPGTSFLAVPGYAVVRVTEGLLGVDPDSWSALTRNAWLASLLSVGLVTALGAVLVLRLARRIASESSARLAALAFAFATMAWPLGTMLFEHNIIAVALLAGLYCIERAFAAGASRAGWLQLAGVSVGYAAIANYTMAVFVVAFAALLFVRDRSSRSAIWFGSGVLWPLLLICAYNVACFGTPFTTNYAWQSTLFQSQGRLLGVFALPRLDVLLLLLFSPYRGLFFSSPVLLAAVAALLVMWRERVQRSWIALIGGAMAFLLLVNASFNGWDGGWTAVPRYLGPGIGLLAIPIAVAFDRWRALTGGLAAISFVIQLALTTVDPQVPIGDAGAAGLAPSRVFWVDPMTRYVLPLFIQEQPWPMIDDQITALVAQISAGAVRHGKSAEEIERKAVELRNELRARVINGHDIPGNMDGVTGPVSANPIGIYEGNYARAFPARSEQARGNSFNLGELVFPQSRLSLLPLLVLAGGLLALLFQREEEP